MKNELQTMRLFSPLFPHIYRKNEWGDLENDQTELTAADMVEYEDDILALIEKYKLPSDVWRAAAFFKLIRYSYGSGCTSYGCQPFDIRKVFGVVWEASRRLKDTVVENKDFEALIGQYDRDDAFFYCDPPYYETEGYSLGELFKQRHGAGLCKAYRKGSLPTKMVWLPLFSGLSNICVVWGFNGRWAVFVIAY